jgi:putative ABC transport system ATP-binding protein
LDSVSARRILELLESINTKDGMTVVMVTHDQEIAARAHRRVHVLDGRVIDPRTQPAFTSAGDAGSASYLALPTFEPEPGAT